MKQGLKPLFQSRGGQSPSFGFPPASVAMQQAPLPPSSSLSPPSSSFHRARQWHSNLDQPPETSPFPSPSLLSSSSLSFSLYTLLTDFLFQLPEPSQSSASMAWYTLNQAARDSSINPTLNGRYPVCTHQCEIRVNKMEKWPCKSPNRDVQKVDLVQLLKKSQN